MAQILISSLFQPSSSSIPVVDPKLKQFGRLWINQSKVDHTKAVERWLSKDPRQSSLCLLFSKGECNAGDKCNQLHVDRSHTQAIRDCLAPLHINNCCFSHGDIASIREDFQGFLKQHPLELAGEGFSSVVSLPSGCLAVTAFWDQYLLEKNVPPGTLRISPGRVCRLHQRDSCKFGSDCNNLHVCREFWASVSATTQCAPVGRPRKLSGPPPPCFPPSRKGSLQGAEQPSLTNPESSLEISSQPSFTGNWTPPTLMSPIVVKVSSTPPKASPSQTARPVPPPPPIEIPWPEESLSPTCLPQSLTAQLGNSPPGRKYPQITQWPVSHHAVLPPSPPLAAVRRTTPPGRPASPSPLPSPASDYGRTPLPYANSLAAACSAEPIPSIIAPTLPTLQGSSPPRPVSGILPTPEPPLSRAKYLTFLMYTKSDQSPQYFGGSGTESWTEPSPFEKQSMIEKLPHCLLEELDLDDEEADEF